MGKVVRKDLAFLVKGNLPVPTYVLEYLLGQYCASDDEEMIAAGLEKVKTVIQNNYVHRAASEEVKGKIKEAGRYRIIDKISVQLNDKPQSEPYSYRLGMGEAESEALVGQRSLVDCYHQLPFRRGYKGEMGD